MATLIAILKLLPAILAAIQAIEAAFPVAGAGKSKLDIILGTVSDVYTADQTIQKQVSSDQLVAVITATVNRIVASFDSLGIFQKKAA